MTKPSKGELEPLGFDYGKLAVPVAAQVRSVTERIRMRVKKSVDELIDIGTDLRVVKAALPYGQFGRWLEAEFGWKERMAQNFMAVAQQFGPRAAIIAELAIQPTAASL